jgi:hypothetical protein
VVILMASIDTVCGDGHETPFCEPLHPVNGYTHWASVTRSELLR